MCGPQGRRASVLWFQQFQPKPLTPGPPQVQTTEHQKKGHKPKQRNSFLAPVPQRQTVMQVEQELERGINIERVIYWLQRTRIQEIGAMPPFIYTVSIHAGIRQLYGQKLVSVIPGLNGLKHSTLLISIQGRLVIAVLAVMALVSSWISLRTTKFSRRTLYPIALCSITLGGGAVLAVITQGVLRPDPWFTPQVIIPLAGMIFAASMNSVSLAAERLAAEMRRGDSYQTARSVALKAALIPITNSLFAVGLVSLPGMMTGQILSGVSPLVAARYQIMVMCMMFAAAGLSATLFLLFIRRHTEEVIPTKAD